MFDKNLLKPNAIDLLRDEFLVEIRNNIVIGEIKSNNAHSDAHAEFKENFDFYVQNNKGFKLTNIDQFVYKEVIIGCHHYIDGLMIKYGKENLQILEHDYSYYNRLNPGRKWSVPGKLEPNKPLIIATPFPGYLGIHPQFEDILTEAEEKNIDVHIDGAWLSCSNGINLDVSHSCIASIGISLSKGYAAGWNRIGLRYTKQKDPADPITIYDRVNMCPRSVVTNGTLILENVPMDYMWNTYGKKYHKIVEHFDLDIGNILFAAYSKDRIIYSLTDLLKL